MFDPVQAMLGRREEHRTNNQVRNKLQIHARNLLQKAYRKDGDSQAVDASIVHQLIGKLEGYLAIRNALAPYVAPDGYMNEVKRCLAKLKSKVGV